MLDYFLGEGRYKVDPKGRVSVPHFFRRVIERCDPDWDDGKRPNLVVVYGPESWHRLDCYTVRGHRNMIRRILKMPKGTPDRVNMERIYTQFVQPVQLDEEGRLTVPLRQREKLDLGEWAYMAAATDHFKLWKPEVYDAEQGGGVDAWLASKGADFDPDSLLPDLDDDEG